MTRDQRLRRCLLLCAHFARNLAYYHARRAGGHVAHEGQDFWTSADGNFLDMAALEWCKLFGDPRGEHAWQKIVTNPSTFEAELLAAVGVTADGFQALVSEFRRYRDKFLAHLDSDHVMYVPRFEAARRAVWFYYAHIWANEIDPAWRGDAPGDLEIEILYQERLAEGVAVYAAHRP